MSLVLAEAATSEINSCCSDVAVTISAIRVGVIQTQHFDLRPQTGYLLVDPVDRKNMGLGRLAGDPKLSEKPTSSSPQGHSGHRPGLHYVKHTLLRRNLTRNVDFGNLQLKIAFPSCQFKMSFFLFKAIEVFLQRKQQVISVLQIAEGLQ